MISLIGPGLGFDPGYAMTTDPDDPVITATITTAGEPAGPLLIDGCHRLYKAAVIGREHLPAPRKRSPKRRSPSATTTPCDAHGQDLARRYYERGLRSLSGSDTCS
jgi:hypothetical protein